MRVVMKNRFELVHVGINTESPEKALQLAELLSAMFHLQLRHGKKSEFAGDYFECMKAPFLGSKGHIAMQTDDLAAAVESLAVSPFIFCRSDRLTTGRIHAFEKRDSPCESCVQGERTSAV